DLLGEHGPTAWDAAERAQADGLVRSIGVSVYGHEEALAAADRFPVRTVQIPVSIFDQRPVRSGALAELAGRGVEIHARSVFLQGFALADPDTLPDNLVRFRNHLSRFRQFADHHGATPIAIALRYVAGIEPVSRMLVGVQSAGELEQILSCLTADGALEGAQAVAADDPDLLNPGRW
ncbi:MAG: aldo/keto reductase, partial [Novosphingobium sp.]|nr:aldo/keto reductase [Novosphingobium sp.]